MPSKGLGPHHPFVSAEARERFLSDYDRLAAEWPLTWETATIDTDLGATCVQSTGPLDARPMVLLPGAGGDAVLWPKRLIETLATNYRVHAVDSIDDFGRTVCSRPIRQTSDRMMWLDQVLDVLSPGAPVVLGGGSRGAWFSAEYALHAPDRLTANIWLSPALVTTGFSPGALRFMSVSMPAMRRPTFASVDAMLRWILPAFAAQQPGEFHSMVEHTRLGFECFDTSLVGTGWGPRRFTTEELRSLRVPVLYLAGADERLCSSKAGVSRVNRVAPLIQTAILPRAGHDMIWVEADEVGRRIVEFLG